jgi:hypothetical protein
MQNSAKGFQKQKNSLLKNGILTNVNGISSLAMNFVMVMIILYVY